MHVTYIADNDYFMVFISNFPRYIYKILAQQNFALCSKKYFDKKNECSIKLVSIKF